MKSLKQYITESMMILEKFACDKLRKLAKKHGKVVPDSPFAPFGFVHDKNLGVNLGRLVAGIVPHLTDDDFIMATDKVGANFDNGDELIAWLKDNAKEVNLNAVNDITALGSNPYMQKKLFNAGYFWIVFKDNCIALFKVKNPDTLKECNQAITKLSQKFKNKKQ